MLMLILTLCRINVIVAMTVSAIVAGLTAGLGLSQTVNAFNDGLSGGAEIALSYAMLGTFAVAISKSGLTRILASKLLKQVNDNSHKGETTLSYLILSIILLSNKIVSKLKRKYWIILSKIYLSLKRF